MDEDKGRLSEEKVLEAVNDLTGMIDMWYDEGDGRDLDLTDEEYQEVLIRTMKELLPTDVILRIASTLAEGDYPEDHNFESDPAFG